MWTHQAIGFRRAEAILLPWLSLLVASVPPGRAAAEFVADAARSKVEFSVTHLRVSTVRGKLTDYSVRLTTDATGGLARAHAVFRIASIDTGSSARDTNLRDVLFQVQRFPHIEFVGTNVAPRAGTQRILDGRFTMHGVTRPMVLPYSMTSRPGSDGRMRRVFRTETTLRRSDYGLLWNRFIEGAGVVGETVKVTIELEAAEELIRPADSAPDAASPTGRAATAGSP
jgi:polyisoprenoid-binding protein YceI